MTSQVVDWIQISFDLLNQSSQRIFWNLFLAFIPLYLSYYLFRLAVKRSLVWWILLLIFVTFLPNAPYILTDSIHILELSQKSYPVWSIILILIPQYILFISLGFEAYVLSLINLDNYLVNFQTRKYLIIINAIAHSLSAVGIYLGRFERFNSWDLVTKPGEVILTTGRDLLNIKNIFSLAIASILIWLVTELIKLVNNSFALTNSKNN
ncbi:MAG: DUF1361 domain-containing protein [Pleurocapsa sp. MO_226.B13]|nr:DUF1361 domain-containing protein [Pleurocapsa sp. MO_226.B13]